MKLGLIADGDSTAIALYSKDRWINLSRACQAQQLIADGTAPEPIRRIEDLLQGGKLHSDFLRDVLIFLEQHNLTESFTLNEPLQFLLPLRPGKIIALGRNYREHAAELDNEVPSEPLFFCKSPHTCIGPGRPIMIRDSYGRVDHEAELAFVIGRRARDVRVEDAQQYIAAYTIVNDVSAREMQSGDIKQGHPWFRSKNLDTFCPMGPVLALPGELGWPVEVDIELKVNGETRQKSNTAKFIFSIPEALAYITKFMTLEAGDMISTGTPGGIGPICPGDTIEVTIPPIGVLRNPVKLEEKAAAP